MGYSGDYTKHCKLEFGMSANMVMRKIYSILAKTVGAIDLGPICNLNSVSRAASGYDTNRIYSTPNAKLHHRPSSQLRLSKQLAILPAFYGFYIASEEILKEYQRITLHIVRAMTRLQKV